MSGERPLSRLQILSPQLLDQLQHLGILTINHLLNANPLQIISYTGLSYIEYKSLLGEIACKSVSSPISALTLLAQQQAESIKSPFLSTGMPPLDQSLRGGLPMGCISDVCGFPGAGKTQFCMFVAVKTLLSTTNNRSIIYIDTELKLDSSRLVQMLSSQTSQRDSLDTLLQRIVIKRPSSLDELKMVLQSLEEEVIALEAPLIIIDSLAALIKRHQFSVTELDRFLFTTTSVLRKVASLCHCAVLVTNQMVPYNITGVDFLGTGENVASDLTNNSNLRNSVPALGVAWQHCVTTRLFLTKLHTAPRSLYDPNDPETSFVFPEVSLDGNPLAALDVSLVPATSAVSRHPANDADSSEVIQTVGKVSVVKCPVASKTTLFYGIATEGMYILTAGC